MSSISSVSSALNNPSFYDVTEDSEDDVLSVSSSSDNGEEIGGPLVISPASDNLFWNVNLLETEYIIHEED